MEDKLKRLQENVTTLFPEASGEECRSDVLFFNRASNPYVFEKKGNDYKRIEYAAQYYTGRGVSLRCVNCVFDALIKVFDSESMSCEEPEYIKYNTERLTEEQLRCADCQFGYPTCALVSVKK